MLHPALGLDRSFIRLFIYCFITFTFLPGNNFTTRPRDSPYTVTFFIWTIRKHHCHFYLPNVNTIINALEYFSGQIINWIFIFGRSAVSGKSLRSFSNSRNVNKVVRIFTMKLDLCALMLFLNNCNLLNMGISCLIGFFTTYLKDSESRLPELNNLDELSFSHSLTKIKILTSTCFGKF